MLLAVFLILMNGYCVFISANSNYVAIDFTWAIFLGFMVGIILFLINVRIDFE